MGSSRIMVVMAIFCFMFLGVSWVSAENTKEYVIGNGKVLTVHYDDKGKIKKGVFEEQDIQPIEIRTLNISIQGQKDKKTFPVYDIPRDTVIYTGPGNTCVWVFDGYRVVYKCT